MLGETLACATVSPLSYILSNIQVRFYPPLRRLHPDFGDFNNGACHVMTIMSTVAESNRDMELFNAANIWL